MNEQEFLNHLIEDLEDVSNAIDQDGCTIEARRLLNGVYNMVFGRWSAISERT